MKTALVSILAVATILRLLTSFVLFPSNTTTDDDNILTQALGPGFLPAVGAAILDPIHTWDHLEEACFWLENRPSLWTDFSGVGRDVGVGYSAIYTPGTRIVAPPLVVAFLGETFVCPGSTFLGVIRTLLLLIADGIGAYCIYHLGKRIFDAENRSNEAEMERHTESSENKKDKEGKFNGDLVIPGILRPERGWIFGLPSKILPPDECLIDEKVTNGASANDKEQKDGNKNDESTENIDTTTSTQIDREPIIALIQIPIVTCILYYCNPISMLANATGSIRSLWDALLLLSFYYATMPPTRITKEGIPIKVPSATKAAISLALATYADAGYAVFLLPVLLWRGLVRCAQTPPTIKRAQHQDWKMLLALYIFYLAGLHYFASLLVGGESREYIKVMVQTILPNVAFVQQDGSGSVPGPSMGLHWYMFVQMFDRFRPYFTVFVGGIPAMFAIPLVTRLHRYPSVLAATFQLLWAIFRPTTTVHTLILGFHLALLNPRTITRMRNPSLVSFFALPVPILLFMTFHRMWLVTGNGNPNYIYFQCFAYGLFVIIISMDFVSATVKRDKVRRMVENGTVKKLAKKKEETQNEVKKVQEQDGMQMEAETAKEQNGNAEKKATEDVGNDNVNRNATEDVGNIPDYRDGTDDKPEPVVVFL